MKQVIIPALIYLIFAGTPAMADREYSYKESDSFDGDKITAIRIDIPRGDIELVESSSGKIEVDFDNVIIAEDQEDADDIKEDCSYETRVEGERLTINIDLPLYTQRKGVIKRLLSGDWDDEINPYLRLKVPPGKNISVESSSADIEVADLNLNLFDVRSSSSDIEMKNTAGSVSLGLSSGDVDIDHHKGDISVKGNSSDINFTDIKGDLDIKTSSGDGRLDNVIGSISVYASSGDYRLYTIDGDLDFRTSSGDVNATGVSGSIRAEASSGDIRLKELTSKDGNFDIESSSGDVTLEVSGDFEGSISLHSNSGSVISRLSGEIESLSESKMKGSIGDGNGRLRVSTISGDIRIDRY